MTRLASLPRALQPQFEGSPRIAVLLNGNARKVKPRWIQKFSDVIPQEDIYYSKTIEEATAYCQEIYTKQYDMVFTGGGDGTLMHCLTELKRCQEMDHNPNDLPVIGVLHLGTGNAVASTLSANSSVLPDLEHVHKGKNIAIRPHRWVVVDGQRAPFAGFGYDSLILNEYRKLKEFTANSIFSFLSHGSIGYAIAVALMAIPKTLFKKKSCATVINEGSTAYLLGPDGQPVKEYAPGETLYDGEITIVGAGTIPCFGYQFNIFPFATTGEHMNLRIANVSSLEAVANLPSLWRGTWRHPRIYDYYADKVRVIHQEPQPLQVGGDAVGEFKETVFSLSPERTYLADLAPARKRPALQPKFA